MEKEKAICEKKGGGVSRISKKKKKIEERLNEYEKDPIHKTDPSKFDKIYGTKGILVSRDELLSYLDRTIFSSKEDKPSCKSLRKVIAEYIYNFRKQMKEKDGLPSLDLIDSDTSSTNEYECDNEDVDDSNGNNEQNVEDDGLSIVETMFTKEKELSDRSLISQQFLSYLCQHTDGFSSYDISDFPELPSFVVDDTLLSQENLRHADAYSQLTFEKEFDHESDNEVNSVYGDYGRSNDPPVSTSPSLDLENFEQPTGSSSIYMSQLSQSSINSFCVEKSADTSVSNKMKKIDKIEIITIIISLLIPFFLFFSP